jgi:hypothetical protein
LDESLQFVCICLFFVVSISAHLFNPLFHKTTVNVEPLSPPVLNKISTHSNNLGFSILLSLRSRFFSVFVICVVFRVPLGTHLNQNGVNVVPKIEHLACFWTPFRHTMPKNTQPTRQYALVFAAPVIRNQHEHTSQERLQPCQQHSPRLPQPLSRPSPIDRACRTVASMPLVPIY